MEKCACGGIELRAPIWSADCKSILIRSNWSVSKQVDWPDGCLGVQTPGVMCTMVITPGYRVILEADGKQYEYHTNASGDVVRLATVQVTERNMPRADLDTRSARGDLPKENLHLSRWPNYYSVTRARVNEERLVAPGREK